MGHAEIRNTTSFVFEPLYLTDEEGRPIVVCVIKATFQVAADGRCSQADEQAPILLSGECWGDPSSSSYRYEPESAFTKPSTDVVLNGYAYAPHGGRNESEVSLQVGALRKQARIFGDRVWYRAAGKVAITAPRPFERIPLVYERAFGGWDRSGANPSEHACEARNPVGRGFRLQGTFAEDVRLPNLEDPTQLIRTLEDKPMPVGFGFVSPGWAPRASYAGTYDERWQRERAPLLPRDFDRRHFNAASVGLITKGYLRGDETIVATGVTHGARPWQARLPGIAAPFVDVQLRAGAGQRVKTVLDTLVVEPDPKRVLLTWRGHARLRSGPHDVEALQACRGDGVG